MNKENIIELLKSVLYPGFSRDIVSFGIIKDISIQGRSLDIRLNIPTDNNDVRHAIKKEVQRTLTDTNQFDYIQIHVDETPAKPEPKESKPESLVSGNIKHIVAVASGKGGVGKSTVAANLAVALANKGHRTGLLDLDIYGPSLPIIFGANKTPDISDDKKLIPLALHGVKVMSFGFLSGNKSPTIWRGPLVSKMTQQFFRDVQWGDLDVLILDLPPGTGDIHLTLTQHVKLSGAVIVTTPQDMALADVQKGADMFRKVNVPVFGVVENMSGFYLEGSVTDGSEITLDGYGPVTPDDKGRFSIRMDIFKRGGGLQESQRLDVPFLGEIPVSADITTSSDKGTPVVSAFPDSIPARCYTQLADQLSTRLF